MARLDKWLWAARFYKTRTLATTAIAAGHVRVGGERAKPAHPLKLGERVAVRKGAHAWEVEVTALDDRRGSATDAAKLYLEDPASRKAREDRARVIAALEAEAHPDAGATARWMRAYADPDKS